LFEGTTVDRDAEENIMERNRRPQRHELSRGVVVDPEGREAERPPEHLQGHPGMASRRVLTTIEEFVDPVAAAHVVPMILQPGAIRAEIVMVDFGDVSISVGNYSFSVATRGETLPDRVALVVPARRLPSAHVNGVPLAPRLAFAFGGEAEVVGVTGGPADFATISLSPASLERMAGVLGVELDLPGRGEFRAVPAPTIVHLRRLLIGLRQQVRDTGKAVSCIRNGAAISEAVVGASVPCFAADTGRTLSALPSSVDSVHVVGVCCDFAAAARYQNVTLADLSAASNASERRLRSAFYDCLGMSPTAYLRIAALNGVRHQLLDGPARRDAVTRAAHDYGFWHLSRFAGQYRTLFGESPSRTLARKSAVAPLFGETGT
jgi:AraC family transcriptional regulator, ethanolamine operon transcriptional activator